jgi:phosphatidylethanolamine N-methyltransferase
MLVFIFSKTQVHLADLTLYSRVANVTALDKSAYSLNMDAPEQATPPAQSLPDLPRSSKMTQYQLGEPIRVNWTAPSNCSRRDWIGLYRHGANKSKLVTRIRSKGRWLGIYPDEWDGNDSLSPGGTSTSQGSAGPKKRGSLLFTGNRLFWKTGQYEFRYHHDGKHNVMAVSEPFEIMVEKPVNPLNYASVYSTLLPLVTRCLDSDPQLVPETAWPLLGKNEPDENVKAELRSKRTDEHDFVLYENEQAERIASVIEQSCGIELMSEVIIAEANLAKLTRSIVESEKLLRPFDKLEKT